MITAEITISKEQLLSFTQPMQFIGIDWETYEEISEEMGESHLQITFNNGTLTVMPITELHELLKSLLHNFVTFTGMLLRRNIIPTGQATMRLKSRKLAVEPDLSFFVQNADNHQLKRNVPNELETPPDIVVEIDFYHLSDSKFEIYSEFGVPEFWQYQDEKLKIFELAENGEYKETERSGQLPILTSSVLTEFMDRGQNEEQFKVLTDFQTWLEENK
ncbi:MAG: Uma2 family endonuclease [Pyrinomonadaceae bacterium]